MKIYSISEYVTTEIIIDKSRFIADLFPVNDSSEAISKLDLIKELHPKANHHCYAYIIGYSSEQQKFSDDGEPGGTAGMPILNVLKHLQKLNHSQDNCGKLTQLILNAIAQDYVQHQHPLLDAIFRQNGIPLLQLAWECC
jgi:L-cysteine desulfidase